MLAFIIRSVSSLFVCLLVLLLLVSSCVGCPHFFLLFSSPSAPLPRFLPSCVHVDQPASQPLRRPAASRNQKNTPNEKHPFQKKRLQGQLSGNVQRRLREQKTFSGEGAEITPRTRKHSSGAENTILPLKRSKGADDC